MIDRRDNGAPLRDWAGEKKSAYILKNVVPSDIAGPFSAPLDCRRARTVVAKPISATLMRHLMIMRASCAAAQLLLSAAAWGAGSDGPPSVPGAKLYEQFCSSCHDHPHDRIPARDVIDRRSPEEVMQTLTNGAMRTQAAGLNMNDRVAVASYVTGRAPTAQIAAGPEGNPCSEHGGATITTGSSWNGWGGDLENSRYQPDSGLLAADVPHLKVKWAFGYRATYIYGQPTVAGGRVYVTSSSGRVYALDARTGCTHWTFDAAAAVRTAVSIITIQGVSGARLAAVFGDDAANVYALDADHGGLVWTRKLDQHPDARITGAPVFYNQRLYVPVSSLEELSALSPRYQCCKFRGSVVALEARHGKVIWQTYIVDQQPKPYRKAESGTQLYGPAGGAVWSAPTLDPKRGQLYVGTGNSYTDVPTARTDSIVALDMRTGAVRWVNQLRPQDNYIVGCDTAASAGKGNCPQMLGPDADFGASPILRTLTAGGAVLLTGAKSGAIYALDPRGGRQLWSAQVGIGSALGGIEWGGAADKSQLYVAVSDAAAPTAKPGGLIALRIADGKQVWRTDPPAAVCSWGTRNCIAAQSQAVSAIPGVVFSGSQDGHLRAYASADGSVIWDFDTAQSFATVNGVAAAGGSLDNGGATVADGMLYVNSGYGRITGQPGNLLLAFAARN
jgi:polyvinyl alcohol dehydrogenase (cytochrome)